MTEISHLCGRELEKEIPQWMGVHGKELISNRTFRIYINPNISADGQRWSSQNMPHAQELDKAAEKYGEFTDGKIISFESCEFNGKTYTLEDLMGLNLTDPSFPTGKREVLTINTVPVSYKEAVMWTNGDVPEMNNPHACVVSVIAKTTDGSYVFTKRSEGSGTGKGKIGCVGGVVEDPPKVQAITEIEEELNIQMPHEDDSEDFYVHLHSISLDSLNRPIIVYTANLPYSSSQIREAHAKSESAKSENTELIFVDDTPEGWLEFAKKTPPTDTHEPTNLLVVSQLRRHFLTSQEDEKMQTVAESG